MTTIDRPSPNHDTRGASPIDMLVLHYTGMQTGEAALARMCDPAAKVSAHYMIEEDGRVFHLVPEDRRAWHAGVSCWRGQRDVNARSIGIELVNPGHEFGYRDFPDAQIAALVVLARGILDRHPIPARNVVGHSDVAPARKTDPGERFPWRALAAAGIGLWPREVRLPGMTQSGASDQAIQTAQINLARIGYTIDITRILDETTHQVVIAFQRRFRPQRVDGLLDDQTTALIAAVAAAS
jgi:N-acetylmuramoyl-L-alanine amidase